MHSLCVIPDGSPLPADRGFKMRALNLITATAMLGSVDIVLFGAPDANAEARLSSAFGGARVISLRVPQRPWTRASRARWLTSSRLPLRLFQQVSDRPREDLAAWLAPRYDLALYIRHESYRLAAPVVDAPAVVDIDDVPQIVKQRERTMRTSHRGSGSDVFKAFFDQTDLHRWNRVDHRMRAAGAWFLVCSEPDRARYDATRTLVVPNGFDIPAHVGARSPCRRPPTLLFQGEMRYPPNADAAAVLVGQVLPLLRARIPGATCTIVGPVKESDRARWQQSPGVTVTGAVASMEPMLAAADLVVVPMRLGGGTRLKILEAFAYRVPVVSTTMGAEGLGVATGRELLLADSPAAIAEACVQLLDDAALRERLVDAAEEHLRRHFTWAKIRDDFAGELAKIARGDTIP